jgi:D-alanyl-D-alanine carboxypeptidase
MPALVPAAAPLPQPTAAAAARPQAMPLAEAPNTVVVAAAEPAAIATAAKAGPIKSDVAKPDTPRPDTPRMDAAKAEPTPAQIRARGGWLIQIGAYEGEDEARQHLSVARLKIPGILAAADPFTERVQKGDKALYRARFAGFDKAMAEAACRQLKRSDIACMTVKN